MWASYQLGRFYLFGIEGIQKDKEKAMKFLRQHRTIAKEGKM